MGEQVGPAAGSVMGIIIGMVGIFSAAGKAFGRASLVSRGQSALSDSGGSWLHGKCINVSR